MLEEELPLSDILTKIETYKRDEIAAAKQARPLAEIEALAKAAPARAVSSMPFAPNMRAATSR